MLQQAAAENRAAIDLTRHDVDEAFVIHLANRLSGEAAVRPDVVRGAALLLDPRLAPSAADVADALVRRLVCDRIR